VSQIDEITFLRKLQRLLDEGDFVATYKFALLQALADLSVEKDVAADGTLYLGLEELGEKFVEYYWPQARPYKNGVALLQNMGRQAAIVNRVAEAQSRYDVERTWRVTNWAYEQAELANSRVWGRAEEFSSLGSEWPQSLVSNVGVESAGP
jgi:hypothetical protein